METGGSRVMEVNFDASLSYQSTYITPGTSWFKLWRVLQPSTYTDMYNGQMHNQFNVEGLVLTLVFSN